MVLGFKGLKVLGYVLSPIGYRYNVIELHFAGDQSFIASTRAYHSLALYDPEVDVPWKNFTLHGSLLKDALFLPTDR